MTALFVAKTSQFPNGERRIAAHKGREIGGVSLARQVLPYENLCVHQGPACGHHGAKVEDVLVLIAAGSGRSFPATRFTSCARGMATNTISRPANAPPIAV
jgi:nitrite reductase/ring-hydroxylating ferredoxin subunit